MSSSAVHHFSSPAEAITAGIHPPGTGTAAPADRPENAGSGAVESAPVHHFSSLPRAAPGPHPEPASRDADPATVSALQARVAAALAQGCSVSAAARTAGVHRTTVHHWQRTSPRFRAAVDQARREFTESLADDMLDLAHSAVRTLQDLLDNPGTPAAIRLRAALAVLERPQFPKRGWNLPARLETPAQQELADVMAELEADYRIDRMTEAIRKHEARGAAEDDEPAGFRQLPQPATAIPRSAPCPCGSGQKYKRCCGKHAPPVFSGNTGG